MTPPKPKFALQYQEWLVLPWPSGGAPHRPQCATRTPRSQASPRLHPAQTLRTTESGSSSHELRSISRDVRLESKLGAHPGSGATLSSAPFGRFYQPAFAPPSPTPPERSKPIWCELRCEDDVLRRSHSLTASDNSPFIERGSKDTPSFPSQLKNHSLIKSGHNKGSTLSSYLIWKPRRSTM